MYNNVDKIKDNDNNNDDDVKQVRSWECFMDVFEDDDYYDDYDEFDESDEFDEDIDDYYE
jgi:hypothetical protein